MGGVAKKRAVLRDLTDRFNAAAMDTDSAADFGQRLLELLEPAG